MNSSRNITSFAYRYCDVRTYGFVVERDCKHYSYAIDFMDVIQKMQNLFSWYL